MKRKVVVAQLFELTRTGDDTAGALLGTSTVGRTLWFHKDGNSQGLHFEFLLSGSAVATIDGEDQCRSSLAASEERQSILMSDRSGNAAISLLTAGGDSVFAMSRGRDAKSPPRFTIGAHDDQAGIQLLDDHGRERLGLLHTARATGLSLTDRGRSIRSLIGLTPTTEPRLGLNDSSMRTTLDLTLNRLGIPMIRITNPVTRQIRAVDR